MIGLLLQLSVAGAITATAASSDGFYRDREAIGVRWRSGQLIEMGYQAPLTLQVGLLVANENGLFPSKSGAGVRHWAVALEQALSPSARVGVIYGRFIEQRSEERPHPGLVGVTYYQLVAGSLELHRGPYAATLEVLLAPPVTVHAGLHTAILRLRSPPLDVMAQRIDHAPGQAAYRFHTIEGTLRPLWWAKAPWKYVGLQGGWRPVLSYERDRSVRLDYLNVGVLIGGVVP